MTGLVLDRYEYPILERQRREHAAGESVPRRWHWLIDALSNRLSGHPVRPFGFREIAARRAKLFTWIPSPEALLAALWGSGLIYLCWGGLGRSGIKGIAERTILRRAEYLLVNDAVTQAEIKHLIGRSSVMMPYSVDTNFFAFSGHGGRRDFLFCSNTNDRDPEVLLALAEAGQKVVWTVDDVTLRGAHAGRHPNLQLVPRISFPKLRMLYQTCRAVVMPLCRDAHTAGQTAILEAISCGAPVVISSGRTASIFDHVPAVSIVRGTMVEDWLASLSRATTGENAGVRAEKSRYFVEQQWSFDRVLEQLYKSFTDPQFFLQENWSMVTTSRHGQIGNVIPKI